VDKFYDQHWALPALVWVDNRLDTRYAAGYLVPGGLWDRWAAAHHREGLQLYLDSQRKFDLTLASALAAFRASSAVAAPDPGRASDFIREVLARPGDEGPLLVFADWLEERGDVRGELLRLNVEIGRDLVTPRPELERRRKVLAGGKPDKTDPEWIEWAIGQLANEVQRKYFICDCALRVLPLFERERPGDGQLRKVIDTARRFVRGKATGAEASAVDDVIHAAEPAP
jgi:uncharacterized protein (TIGR02996 family)